MKLLTPMQAVILTLVVWVTIFIYFIFYRQRIKLRFGVWAPAAVSLVYLALMLTIKWAAGF